MSSMKEGRQPPKAYAKTMLFVDTTASSKVMPCLGQADHST